tara:strand:- start:96 stop:941 length:846 start_codon:yes stop_codon:yes gene_type:complete
MSLRYVDPMKETPEGKLLGIVKQLEDVVKAKYGMGCKMEKGMCKDETCCPQDTRKADDSDKGYKSNRGEKPPKKLPSPKGRDKDFAALAEPRDKITFADKIAGATKGDKKIKKADMSEKNKYCQKHFGCDYSECSEKQKAQCNRECGKVEKEDATTAFLRERGIFVKYEQEKTVENGVPQLLEQPAGTRATVYSTNHRIPAMNDGPSKSIISEVAKMPSVAQTGYDTNASSLHMHLNYAGGVTDNLDSAEDALASLRKAHPDKIGIIEEIASLTEQVYARL